MDEIVDITLSAAETVRRFNVNPKIALLSFSNFGGSSAPDAEKMAKATAILQEKYPDLIVDGELQANFAVNQDMLREVFPFSKLVNQKVNTLIFPSLSSGNISYKLLQSFGVGDAIGPILLGVNRTAHVCQIGCSVREIVNMAAVAVADAQTRTNA